MESTKDEQSNNNNNNNNKESKAWELNKAVEIKMQIIT